MELIKRIKRKIAGTIKNLRIVYYYNFNRNYIRESLSKRKGNCKMCGKCCLGCYLLKDNKCIAYSDRPRWCQKDFPIDERDLKLAGIEDCGYYWENDK